MFLHAQHQNPRRDLKQKKKSNDSPNLKTPKPLKVTMIKIYIRKMTIFIDLNIEI